MAEFRQKQKQPSKSEEPEKQDANPGGFDEAELQGDSDDLLDEIDRVLEVNAAEFVANYVQKGGQ